MKQIIVGVDTNILLHFGKIELFKWRALFPDVTDVQLLISGQVQDEMDEQKDKARGYIQTRAREYQRILRTAEESDYRVSQINAGVKVEIVFLDHVRKGLLNGESFDLDRADQLIVAQYKYAAGDLQGFVVLANDAKTIRAARACGMTAVRPDTWEQERAEPEDESAKELRELRKIVGARPKLNLSGFIERKQHSDPESFAPGFDVPAYLRRLDASKMAATQLPTPSELVAKWGVVRQNGPFNVIMPYDRLKLYPENVSVYAIDFHHFEKCFENSGPEAFLMRLRSLAQAYVVDLEVANVGEAIEETICVEFSEIKNGALSELGLIRENNDWYLAQPIEPRPQSHPAPVNDSAPDDDSTEHEPDHEFGAPKTHSGRQVFRCRSLMHGRSASIRTYVRPLERAFPTEILVSVSAKRQVTPIIRRISIESVGRPFGEQDIDALLHERALLMPSKQRDLVIRALEFKNGYPA